MEFLYTINMEGNKKFGFIDFIFFSLYAFYKNQLRVDEVIDYTIYAMLIISILLLNSLQIFFLGDLIFENNSWNIVVNFFVVGAVFIWIYFRYLKNSIHKKFYEQYLIFSKRERMFYGIITFLLLISPVIYLFNIFFTIAPVVDKI